ncbi:hypothetical protein IAT38_002217 [Cryptococcus sp. DSM 104549]
MVLPIINATKSFWIEGADSPLSNHRSTPDLPAEVDVVIVGSGYAGSSMAYWLHKFSEEGKTPSMLMLEARDVCGGATGRNGGQLRPHWYSRYPTWSSRFGPTTALSLIAHEASHLPAFSTLFADEGIAEEVCFKTGETFDAAMTPEAWTRLKGAYDALVKDWGEDKEGGKLVGAVRVIEDKKEAEEFTQMKGCIGAVVHPTGQVWPYKFVHALLRIVMDTGFLNLQANTPAQSVSEKDADGWITVKTDRGEVRARAVFHATNRWASHLLEEFGNLIFPDVSTVCAIKAPEGLIKRTGAQHWDSEINNYHLQLPPPFNTIILGGARPVLVHTPEDYTNSDREDRQLQGAPKYFASWPAKAIVGWEGEGAAEMEKGFDEGGVWTGVETTSIDAFPFIGPVPNRPGHFVGAGFGGHGMPRILGSTAHVAPLLLTSLNIPHSTPKAATAFPPLPEPFLVTPERVERLQHVDAQAKFRASVESTKKSAEGPWSVPLADYL